MAATTFDVLEALGRKGVPSVAGTKVSGYHRWVEVRGPFKTEFIFYQCGASSSFTDGDSVVSQLAHPMAVEVAFTNCDAAEGGSPSATLEGVESESTFRTITVHDADGVNGAGLLIKVHGF